MHRQHARRHSNKADGGEILARIVADIGEDDRTDGERAGEGEQDGVPSGALLATWRAPIDPPAPPRLSMTICWPSASPSLSAMARAMMVALPPGGNGTTRVIGRFG
jgi:hypothetical protein